MNTAVNEKISETNVASQSITSSTRPAIHGCRFCGSSLHHSVVDLGMHPLCENFLTRDQLNHEEPFYPLHAYVCEKCYLVQVEEYIDGREIFEGDYAYFSSYSTSWLEHAKNYVTKVTERFQLNQDSFVVELASNDGYLLKNFVDNNVPCMGIEPASNVAKVAVEKGVPTRVAYFGVETAKKVASEGIRANLMIANNCLAHVHDLNDFVGGMKIVLAEQGVLTVEYPTAVNMIELNQFDTIYQEHYCYFTLTTLQKVFRHHGMEIFDLDEIPTHGGSHRIYVRHQEDDSKPVSSMVIDTLAMEEAKGFKEISTYTSFSENVKEIKRALLEFLIEAKRAGKSVVGYGAPGKGNTMLNYCGIREDFLDYVVDRNPYKHGKFLPGTHIPVYSTDKIEETKPDYILILPWNLKDEISQQLEYTRQWGAKLVVPIPHLHVF